ncbi:hypothetical protein KJ758_00050, partial [Patescibacteria group bacterium]|nr:hypothetical protein [Patescibacteria group bacterium]
KFNYPDQDLVRAVDVFGGFVTKDNYRFMKQLLAGELTPEQEKEAKILGIEKTGADGIQELRAKLKNFTSEVLTMDGPNPDLLLQSDILKDFMKSFVRFSGSRFGEHGEDKFLNTIKYFEQIKEKAKKLNEEYRPSHIITIQAIDQAKQAQIEISEQGLNRFKTFQDALREAVRLYDHPEALMPILQKIQEKLDVKKMDLEQKQANLSNEKARASIQKNIDALNSIQLDANTNWQETFSKLISFKNEFRDELLTAVFWWSLKIKPDSIGAVKELIEKETPAFNDLSQALDFIDHITNRETLKKFFIDTKAAKNFDYLLNVSALQDELARLQNQESKGTMKMQFVPGRNLLTEFSGHIADACWASKYPSIIEEFPNFTSLMMVLNPDNPQTRRLAGAAFLIETTAEDGRELLIIRGLNPQENVINSLKVNDFYKKITEYLKEIAGSMGRELAIVIDDHSGGSASNRPVLYNHLSGLQEKLQKIKPAHDEDTTFNGYHIQDNIYLV